MYEDVMKEFDKLAECHRQILVEAASNVNEEIWINMCNLYGFRGKESELKECCWKYSQTRQKGVSK
jgi:hypothetical protein